MQNRILQIFKIYNKTAKLLASLQMERKAATRKLMIPREGYILCYIRLIQT